jgi:uncharacterized protein YndB with AHSA1/START domain
VNEPLRMSLTVACPPDHAFATWAERTSLWWPAGHTVTGEHDLEIVFEPHVGGRIFERTASGREEDWGQVLGWDPPRRLAYLWHLRADRADATEVEIAFAGQADGSTRVDIEHRGWERLGSRGPGRRDANHRGWGGLLPHFVAAAQGPSDDPSPRGGA